MPKHPNRLLTDAFREIRKTMSRFLSLFLLSALAVAFLAGLRTTAPDMERSADLYYDEHSLMDIHILSTLGLTADDIAALAAQEGVSAAEGAYSVDSLVHLEENDLVVKLLSLSAQGINSPQLLSGRLPESETECAVEPALLKSAGLSLGDTIAFDTGDGSFEDALKHTEFTIVGTVQSPLYISIERGSATLGSGKVNAFALLPESAFSMDYYTDAYLLADGARDLWCYDDAYQDQMDALIDQLEPLGDARAPLRNGEVVDEANEKLAEAQTKLDDAQADADQELGDAEQTLSDARTELDDGWAEYSDGLSTFYTETGDAKRKIADGERELPDALQKLQDGERDYIDGVAELEDGKQKYADGLKEYEDGAADYEDGLHQWQDGLLEYNDGYQTLLDGEKEYGESLQKLQDGQKEYDDGLKEYQDGVTALAEGGGQLTYAKQELDKAKAQLDSGSASLDAGAAQLAAAKQQYADALAAINDYVKPTLTALGLDPSDPPAFAMGLMALAASPEGQTGLLGGVVVPLHGVLSGLLTQMSTSDEQYPALSALVGALASIDENTLPAMLQDPTGGGIQTLSYAILGALQAADTGLEEMAKQIAGAQSQLDSGSAALSSGAAQYREGKKLYEENLAAFNDSVAQLQDAKTELDDAKTELDDGWAKLADGRRELDDGWVELGDAKVELDDGWADLVDAQKKLADGKQELIDSAQKLLDGEQELVDGRKDLDDGWKEYRDGVAELQDGKRKLPGETAKAWKELSDALLELQDGEMQYHTGLVDYTKGKAEADEKLSDARQELNDARRKVADIEACEWYVLGRNTNIGYVSFQQDSERMGNLASVFPLIFFLVAALVCLTTMTRMVEEQRVQIGCMKAMGYGKGAIALKYVGYGFLSSFLGGAAGLALGLTGIPFVIYNAWRILYTLGDLQLLMPLDISLGSLAAAVACVTLTALASSYAALSAVPAELMRPRAPKPGKRVLLERVSPLWRRLSFTWKVTMRNLFRYKKRFWMTVIGIGGCTALIVTGFGIRNSIYDLLSIQFDEISTYHTQISLADNVTEDEMTEISRALGDTARVERWMPCYEESLSAVSPERSMDVTLFAVEDTDTFQDFIHLRHRLDSQSVTLPENGVILTEKLATMLGVKVGDTITLDGDKRVEATVVDTTENYVYHYVYLTAGYYAQIFGAPPKDNVVLARYTQDTKALADSVASDLISLSGVNSVSRIEDSRATFTKSMESVDYAVILIIVCAAALAFVVLYNLTNINITERQRELATLKVLGFYDGELSAYVYRENIFLTIFGILIGLVMGKYLHQWLVLTVEIDMVMFGRSIRPSSYLLAVGFTALFSLLVNLAAHRKLKRVDMVESLKTVD